MRRTRFAILGIRVSFALVVDLYACCPVAYRDNGIACQRASDDDQSAVRPRRDVSHLLSSTGHRQARARSGFAKFSLPGVAPWILGGSVTSIPAPRSLGPSGDHRPTPRGSILGWEDAKRTCVCITTSWFVSRTRADEQGSRLAPGAVERVGRKRRY